MTDYEEGLLVSWDDLETINELLRPIWFGRDPETNLPLTDEAKQTNVTHAMRLLNLLDPLPEDDEEGDDDEQGGIRMTTFTQTELETGLQEMRERLNVSEDDQTTWGALLNYLRANMDDIADCFAELAEDDPDEDEADGDSNQD